MKKIMLVDDVHISNFIMKTMLERMPHNLEVHDFVLPEVAITKVNEIKPDLIFLDLNMPVVDGWLFLEIMKRDQLPSPVIILTSSTNDLDIDKSKFFNNVKNFLVKPINKEKLEEVLQSSFLTAA